MIRDPLPQASDLEVLLIDVGDSRLPVRGRIVQAGTLAVGRFATSDLALPADDRDASREHFVVELGPAFCRLTNKSRHGTFVNGMQVKADCDLRHGDLVRAGVAPLPARRDGPERQPGHARRHRAQDRAPPEVDPAAVPVGQHVGGQRDRREEKDEERPAHPTYPGSPSSSRGPRPG